MNQTPPPAASPDHVQLRRDPRAVGGRVLRAGAARFTAGLLSVLLVMAGVVVGAGASAAGASSTAVTHETTHPELYYVSLGDSYSVGYQPGHGSTTGYTGVVATTLGMQLENFGCGGATTTSILEQIGCPPGASALTGRVSYPTTTQAAAAEAFIQDHRGQVGLVTISIGGNTITFCAGQATPVTCVATAMNKVKSNLTTLLAGLRAAGGPALPIIGLTYPDVILGAWVYPSTKPNQTLAKLSVAAFVDFINPGLKSTYAAAGAGFVDVTTATGVTTPITETTTLAPYGTIPKAVATVCELTYFCTSGTIHANTTGYTLIGNLVVSQYRSQVAKADGYWEVASDGGIFAFGTAAFDGSMGGKALNAPIVGIAAAPTGKGYWEVASDGGIFAFGTAKFYGSMGGKALNAPVVGIAAAPTGFGYSEVASDGGIFAFGSAQFYGSMGGKPLNKPVVGMAATPTGFGYWEVASDGGIFAFGTTTFYGSMGGKPLNKPIVGLAVSVS